MATITLEEIQTHYLGRRITHEYSNTFSLDDDNNSNETLIVFNQEYTPFRYSGKFSYETPRGNSVVNSFTIRMKDGVIETVEPMEAYVITDCDVKYSHTKSVKVTRKAYKMLAELLESLTE